MKIRIYNMNGKIKITKDAAGGEQIIFDSLSEGEIAIIGVTASNSQVTTKKEVWERIY